MSAEANMTNAQLNGCAFPGWQCFHCGEVFTTVGGARTHFGTSPDSQPGCMVRVSPGAELGLLMALRRAEEECRGAWAAVHNETLDAHRAMHAMQSRHADALRDAEELGYSRGLRDGAIDQARRRHESDNAEGVA